jgi:two-component system NtrC family sensor kinase
MQTLEPEESLRLVLVNAQQFTRADLAKIYLVDAHENLREVTPTTVDTPVSGHVKEERLLLTLAQQAANARHIKTYTKTAEPEWRHQTLSTVLTIPLISRDKLIGMLALGNIQTVQFSNYDIQWLSIFCNQAVIAIENAWLFQNLSTAYIDLAHNREKLLRSQSALQVLRDGITDGLYILNQDLTIYTLNHIEAQRQGFQADELIGQSFLSLGWVDATPDLIKQIQQAFETGQKTTWIPPEQENLPDLNEREFRIYPIRNRLAQSEQVVIFAQDVSERRRWQASLFRSANLAAVGQLAGSVAHQINNPLTVTMTNSQLIMLDTPPTVETYELAAEIFKAGERIQNIVTNLLEFSNQEEYFFVQTQLVDTIEGALELVVRSLTKAQIRVVKEYRVQPILSASVSHLKLVWINLLTNARDAVIGFTDAPQITITTEAISEREVRVSISDNGVGIPKQNFERLFRPFFTTKPLGKALGLGLYSVHAIVERHQGQIKAFSNPGVETTFEVTLPLDNPRDV